MKTDNITEQNQTSHELGYSTNNGEQNYEFPDVNRVTIAGKLVHDPPLRCTKKGIAVTNFIIKTFPELNETDPDLERKSCYVSVVVWAKQAHQCSKSLRKGSAVLVMGELQSMPNAKPNTGFMPVQVNAQWIQFLQKDDFTIPMEQEDILDE